MIVSKIRFATSNNDTPTNYCDKNSDKNSGADNSKTSKGTTIEKKFQPFPTDNHTTTTTTTMDISYRNKDENKFDQTPMSSPVAKSLEFLNQLTANRRTLILKNANEVSTKLNFCLHLAAKKNGEFSKSPKKSNSLAQTLLQRRHWFALLDHQKEIDEVVRIVSPPRRILATETTTLSSISPIQRPRTPKRSRKRLCPIPDNETNSKQQQPILKKFALSP